MVEDELQRQAATSERWELLRWLDRMLAGPLVVLSFVWIGILVLEFVVGTDARLDVLFYVIWAVFILEVLIELTIAPDRAAYLRANWLKILALVVPALRALRALTALRFLRAAGAIRSASLLRLVTSLNRGIGALSHTLDRTGFVYVLVLTVLVVVLGSAGLLFFEAPASGAAITDYGQALWWAAITLTTIGADFAPITPEGRVVGWLLSVYALGVFGYITATIASHFLGPAGVTALAPAPAAAREAGLANEIAALRAEIARLSGKLEAAGAADQGRTAGA